MSMMATYFRQGPSTITQAASSSSSCDSTSPPSLDAQCLQQKFKNLSSSTTTTIASQLPRCPVSPRPIPNSYWVTPQLIACEYPWAPQHANHPKLDELLRVGVRTFIDLTEDGELLPYESILCTRATVLGIDPSTVEYHRFPIQDRCLPKTLDFMDKVFTALRENEQRGRVSAIHCRGGIGRTGLVVGCWLVESGVAKTGEEALRIIASEWKTVEKYKRYPHSPETGPQFDFVYNFKPTKTLKRQRPGPDAICI